MIAAEATESLRSVLERHTRPGTLYERMPDDWVRCYACGHRCKIGPGKQGICRVRYNENGTLMVPHGYTGGIAIDPIEKKPFYHAYPGAQALSFGMLGCDFRCGYCQNWITSQALRDPAAGSSIISVTPEALIAEGERRGIRIVTSTYNEPLITSEWAAEIFRLAKNRGFVTSYVSNGNGTPNVIEYLKPVVDLYKIDLKSFRQSSYAQLGGKLDNVLETVRLVHEAGMWVEIVTLVVPGLNDSDEELRDIARFIYSVSPDIPWHVTAFHSDYKMDDRADTTTSMLICAAELGYAEGLRYVYAGNRPGMVGGYEHTYCPNCKKTVIERYGFKVTKVAMNDGACAHCTTPIPGRWKLPAV